MSQKPELQLDWCSYAAAKYAVEHWHYSQTMPTSPMLTIGVWEAQSFIGCLVYSRGASQHIGRPFGLQQTEIGELTRLALTHHHTSVSRIMRISLILLRKRCPGLRLIVSYADPTYGHVGGVYQAAGWLYLGQTDRDTEYVSPDGKHHHRRMISPLGVAKMYGRYLRVWRPDQCQAIPSSRKYKYILPLDTALHPRVVPLAQPYPKRAASIVQDAPSDQGGEGGLQPTAALH